MVTAAQERAWKLSAAEWKEFRELSTAKQADFFKQLESDGEIVSPERANYLESQALDWQERNSRTPDETENHLAELRSELKKNPQSLTPKNAEIVQLLKAFIVLGVSTEQSAKSIGMIFRSESYHD